MRCRKNRDRHCILFCLEKKAQTFGGCSSGKTRWDAFKLLSGISLYSHAHGAHERHCDSCTAGASELTDKAAPENEHTSSDAMTALSLGLETDTWSGDIIGKQMNIKMSADCLFRGMTDFKTCAIPCQYEVF